MEAGELAERSVRNLFLRGILSLSTRPVDPGSFARANLQTDFGASGIVRMSDILAILLSGGR